MTSRVLLVFAASGSSHIAQAQIAPAPNPAAPPNIATALHAQTICPASPAAADAGDRGSEGRFRTTREDHPSQAAIREPGKGL